MSNYTQSTDFSAKDALASGDPNKTILGADVDTEFGLIATAITSKLDTPSTESAKAAIALPGAVGFYATPSANQTGIVSATNTKILFATEVVDYGSDFASSTFTVPTTGLYLLTATVQSATSITDGKVMFAWFMLNGATAFAGSKESVGVGDSVTLNISWCGYLSSGGTVEVYARHDLGSNVSLDANGTYGSMSFGGARLA